MLSLCPCNYQNFCTVLHTRGTYFVQASHKNPHPPRLCRWIGQTNKHTESSCSWSCFSTSKLTALFLQFSSAFIPLMRDHQPTNKQLPTSKEHQNATQMNDWACWLVTFLHHHSGPERGRNRSSGGISRTSTKVLHGHQVLNNLAKRGWDATGRSKLVLNY